MPDRAAVHAGESHDDVFRVVLLHFEEIAVIHDARGSRPSCRRAGSIASGTMRVERGIGAVDGIGAGLARRVVEIVRRQEAEQLAHHATGTRRRRAP